jgi:hypothetical protein
LVVSFSCLVLCITPICISISKACPDPFAADSAATLRYSFLASSRASPCRPFQAIIHVIYSYSISYSHSIHTVTSAYLTSFREVTLPYNLYRSSSSAVQCRTRTHHIIPSLPVIVPLRDKQHARRTSHIPLLRAAFTYITEIPPSNNTITHHAASACAIRPPQHHSTSLPRRSTHRLHRIPVPSVGPAFPGTAERPNPPISASRRR